MKVEGFAELFRFEGFIVDKITCSADFVQIVLGSAERRESNENHSALCTSQYDRDICELLKR